MHPLNPADYFTLMMDREIRKSGLAGNLCAFVIELDHTPDIPALERRINEFGMDHPICTSPLQKHGRRFFWNDQTSGTLFLMHHRSSGAGTHTGNGHSILADIMNDTAADFLTHPLQFHLIELNDGSYLFAMLWLHPLCDAKGAELILANLCSAQHNKPSSTDETNSGPTVTSYLENWSWWKKLLMFHRSNRYIQKQLDAQTSTLPANDTDQPQTLKFRLTRFDLDQSARVARLAQKHMGITGTTLYPIACLMRAIEKAGAAQPNDAYCVPYAFNLRRRKATAPIFGNQVSFLFAQANRSLTRHRAELFQHLKQQYANAVRHGLDLAFIPMMLAGSWLSLEKYARVVRKSAGGTERASCWFSDIGETEMTERRFFGTRITDMFNLCQITAPPALGLLMSRFDGKLTVSYNYQSPLISENWMDDFEQHLQDELTGQVD